MGRKVPQVTAAEVQAVRALAARLDPEDKKALLREIDKELTQRATTAHHEAGHAVVAVVQGLRFRQINITAQQMPGYTRLGWVELAPVKSNRGYSKRRDSDYLERLGRVDYAGYICQARFKRQEPRFVMTGEVSDLRTIARSYFNSELKIRNWMRRLFDETCAILDRPDVWQAVELLAAELLNKYHTSKGPRAARRIRRLLAR